MPLALFKDGQNEMDNWNQLKFAKMKDPRDEVLKHKRIQGKMVQVKDLMKRKIKTLTDNRVLRQKYFDRFGIVATEKDL
jgi:hypothetical protein